MGQAHCRRPAHPAATLRGGSVGERRPAHSPTLKPGIIRKAQEPVRAVFKALCVGATGFEPVTSSASRKRSAPELSARAGAVSPLRRTRRRPESNRCTSFCRAVPNHSATSPLGRLGRRITAPRRPPLFGPGPATAADPRAEDGGRTRDLNLGKVALYRLSYFRRGGHCSPFRRPAGNTSEHLPRRPRLSVTVYRPPSVLPAWTPRGDCAGATTPAGIDDQARPDARGRRQARRWITG